MAEKDIVRNFAMSMEELEKLQNRVKYLEHQIAEEKALDDNLKNEISMEKVQIELLDRELDLLTKDVKSVEERIDFNKKSRIPQLQNELKAKEEFLATKKEEFRKTLEHYEAVWKKYEAVYNTYPRVAERNELEKKLVLLRSQLLKKKEEIAQKQKEAEMAKENKARRLARLKEELYKWHEIKEKEKAANAELLQQVREIEERIAEKEAKKVSQTNVPVDPPQPAKNAPFRIPSFPDFLKMLGAGQNENQSNGSHSIVPSVTHAPSMPQSSIDVTSKSVLRVGLSNQDQPSHINAAESIGERDVSTSTAAPSSCAENLVQPPQAAPPETLKSPFAACLVSPSGHKKRVITLRTDDIAAKIKESTLHNEESAAQNSIVSTINQDSRLTEESTESQDVIEPNNPDLEKDLSLLPVESAMNNKKNESCMEDDYYQESQDIFENVDKGELSESNFNDYNAAEYREDMYDDLQSPPPFEVVLSPAPAHTSLSPPLSFEEENQANKQDDSIPSSSSFGFGFFKPTANIFGGQIGSNDSSEKKDKTSSSFPFFF
ncbi:Nucleoprotein TPR [Frankliniella fusca]|uniref:Nucleoprotein TPR n=1 Tax=Frankliniella fusca TaxID=407009 RepID=A0AAE1HGP3_9NEOP|nr:Nucleoprotein TPR [Frankliniella fusca]